MNTDDQTLPDETATDMPLADDLVATPTPPSVWKVVLKLSIVGGALALSFFVLWTVFDDLDPAEIRDALRSLEDAELLALGAMWILWLAAQGMQTAALIPALPVRRGIVAFVGPAAVAAVVPGPSDLPVRYNMLTSWGHTRAEATLAVAAGGLFSIGIKLVLPVIAAIGLVVSDSPIEGTLRTVVVISLIVGLGLVVVGFVLSSPNRTERVGRWLDPVWRALMRLLRRPSDGDDLATRLVAARERALGTLRDRWMIATWATVLTASGRFALLLMSLRFTGISEEIVPWPQVFVVFALVQGLTVIPITAGDAGVSEVALIGLLTAAAGSEHINEVTAGVILFRILTWLLIMPVGFGALVLWRRTLDSTKAAREPAPG